MNNCKICSEPWGKTTEAQYCATFPVIGNYIYTKGEPVRAQSWTTDEATAGWRNATILDVYIEKVTHRVMYMVQFNSKRGEEWFARLDAIRIKPGKPQTFIN